MDERTFRAVVASVLVGALVLAIVGAIVVYTSNSPTPSARPSATAAPPGSATPIAPTSTPGPVFEAPSVVSVGQIARGASSGKTLVVRFRERAIDAIPNSAGSFRLTIADQSGNGSTVAFVGTPSIDAPGSLGATVTVVGPNVLMIDIRGSDTVNVEPITITGLGIHASTTAAPGPLTMQLDSFTGSLASGAARNTLSSPGSVAAGP